MRQGDATMTASGTGLRKAVTMRYAVALYMSSVLGSGVLVLPGLAGQVAGPASLIAWIVLSIASYPLAYTFASLSARRPESGGIYGFARESFGFRTANAVGWLFTAWFITGAPVVTVIAASYLAYAFPLSRPVIYVIAGVLMLGAFLVNYRGIIISSKVQLAVIAAIVALLLVTVVASLPQISLANFTPFFPNGFLPIGVAAALIFWSYLGYENVSNVAEEFKNPERDFHRSILLSVLVIGALYLSIAAAAVGTQAYKTGGSVAPFAAMLSNALGVYGAIGTAILAVIIIFGTVNAYMTGISRVIYATAKEGGLPKFLDSINTKTRVPDRALMLLLGLSFLTLTLSYVLDVDLETALLIPSGAAILVYLIGSASGIKLLKTKGARKLYPWISLIISIVMLPFLGILLLVGIAFGGVGLFYKRGKSPTSSLDPSGNRPLGQLSVVEKRKS